jgi:hypothetical protein
MTDKTALHKAVTAVMAEVHSLKKDEKNDHGKYNYVSVDSFKNLVRPLMAKHGLSLSMTEVEFGLETLQNRNGPSVNAKITYQFTLRHESGAEDDPERTTIILPLTGAQTAGAAKSYAIKEYLKGRFLVSTGDKDLIVGGADADAYAPQEYSSPVSDSITAEQFLTIQNLIEKTGTDETKLLAYIKAETLETMSLAQYRTAEAALRKKLAQPKAEAA